MAPPNQHVPPDQHAPPDQRPPQPDFNLLGFAFRTAANEVEKLPNLPAIASGDDLLAEMRMQFAQIHMQFAHLLRVQSISDQNVSARVQNTYLANKADPISPFRNPSTGAVIPGFPATSGAIDQMPELQIDAIVQQLGLQADTPGLPAKRRQLRTHIGLRPQVGLTA